MGSFGKSIKNLFSPAPQNHGAALNELFTPLKSQKLLEEVLDLSNTSPVLIYKHSATCGISFISRRELEKLNQQTDPVIFEVVVQYHRTISNRIAEQLQVTHQSPQVLLLYQEHVHYQASHGSIDAETIRKHVLELSS